MAKQHDYVKFPELTKRQLEEFGFTSPHVQITEDFEAEVVRVIDGDTVQLQTSFRDFAFPLRMLDIDAPELSEGGEISKQWLKGLVEGKKVSILIDKFNRVGKFGRLLGQIVLQGLNVGEMALAGGYALPFGKKGEHLIPDINKMLRLNQWF